MFLPKAFFNGRFLDIDDVHIAANDLGLQRGYGVFDFFKLRDLDNPWIDWYMERLQHSTSLTGLNLQYSIKEIKDFARELLTANDSKDGYIKVLVTAGRSENAYNKTEAPTILMSAMPLGQPSIYHSSGAKLMMTSYVRDLPSVKSTNYMKSAMLADQMAKGGFIDVLYQYGGEISEASRCNFYLIKDKTIYTSNTNILQGITRRRILALDNISAEVKVQDVLVSDLQEAQEAFVSSTTKGVMPVTYINEHQIGNGKVGPVSQELMAQINKF